MKLKLALMVSVVFLGTWAAGQRLPEVAVPQHYTLKLTPDFSSNKFAGEETIDIRVLHPSASITLNALDVTIDEASISAGGEAQKAEVAVQPANEMVTLGVGKPLPPGPVQIRLRYTGVLNKKLRGFYLAEASGRKYAVTQFEPTDARRMFPSFDEPAYKATFDISVVAPTAATAISNTKLIADEPGPAGKHTLRFATTPKMSTYVVALLVGEFECLQGDADGIPLRVCAPPGQQQLGSFGLEATAEFMRYFNRYFSVKYPFGKLDLVAVPDFEAGAMENVGAITFRDTALLVDPKTASTQELKRIAETISHEMAHQWFGDLVTMRWWDDVWLNEGFATWMERKPVAAWKPEWHIEMDTALSAQRAMAADSLQNTRAIRTPVTTPSQINELFDSIAYDKTAAVLHMLESYVGEDAFRAGINKYVETHAYGNATAEDFWTAVTQVTRRPVDKIMASYVDQAGVPFVGVAANCAQGAYVISQQRFRLKPAAGADNEVWTIPVCFKTPGQTTQHCELLTAKQQTFTTDRCEPNVVDNAGALGYYRSNYTRDAMTRLATRLQELTPVERLAMHNNEWALVRMAGGHDIGAYLGLAEGLRGDRTYAVVREMGTRMAYIADNLLTAADRERFEKWVRTLFRPMIQDVGWVAKPGDDTERRALRASVFRTLAYAGRDPEAIAKAQELVRSSLRDPTSVDPSLLDTIFTTAAENGTPALYDEFMARLATAKTPEMYHRYLRALAQFPDPALVKRTLEYAVSPAVRGQDMPSLLIEVLHNMAGRDLAWQFLRTHWGTIEKKGSVWGSAMIMHSTAVFCDAAHKQEVQQFFSGDNLPIAQRWLRQALENVQDCIDMKQQQQPRLASWLAGGGAAGK